jgi:hypothetical protein
MKMFKRIFGVRGYDFKKRQVVYLWKSQIPGHYIRAKIVGINYEVWLDPNELTEGPKIDHGSKMDEMDQYIDEIMVNLKGYYDQTFEEWKDGFCRDQTPEREIAIWVFYSQRFKRIITDSFWDEDERRDIFKMMVVIMNSGLEHAKNNMKYCKRVENDKDRLIREYTRNI